MNLNTIKDTIPRRDTNSRLNTLVGVKLFLVPTNSPRQGWTTTATGWP